MAKYLEISINSLTVRFNQFLNDALPRIDSDTSGDRIAYTASGSVVFQGPQFEGFSLWTVESVVSEADHNTLQLIYTESDYQRRIGGNPNILVTDTIQQVTERSPRSRALASGTTATTQSPYVLYYAQFNAIMPARPVSRKFGLGYAVSFTLQESSKVAA